MGQCFSESEDLTIGRCTFVGARRGKVGTTDDFEQKNDEVKGR